MASVVQRWLRSSNDFSMETPVVGLWMRRRCIRYLFNLKPCYKEKQIVLYEQPGLAKQTSYATVTTSACRW